MQQNTSVSMDMYGLWTESIGGFWTYYKRMDVGDYMVVQSSSLARSTTKSS